MVVPDDDALRSILAAHDVACYALRHNPRIREREILGDHAAPAIGSERNRSHIYREKYTRRRLQTKQPDWPGCPRTDRLSRPPLQELSSFLFFEPLHDLAHVLGAVARANEECVGRFDDY